MRVPHEILRDRITLEEFAGHGAHNAIYSEPRVIRASFQTTQKLVVDSRGESVSVDALVIIRPEDGPVTVESRVTDHGTVYRVVRCYPYPNRRRPSQYELELARWASLSRAAGSGNGS